MARIRALEKECVGDEVLLIYEEIEKVFGRVPNIFKTYAHFPPLLKANWGKLKAVMMGGSLRRELKEAIALVVSDGQCVPVLRRGPWFGVAAVRIQPAKHRRAFEKYGRSRV